MKTTVDYIFNKFDPCHACPIENDISDEYTEEVEIFCSYVNKGLSVKYALSCVMTNMLGKGWRHTKRCNVIQLEKELYGTVERIKRIS
jgi:hypothetical protein